MASLLYLLVATLLLAPLLCHATDPDPLQDFCVADLEYSLPINGFVCKPDEKVVSSDFFFKGLRKEGDTSNPLGSKVTPGNVLTFPGLNTLGISMNRLDLAPGGLNPPHTHPRATESGVVIEGEVLVGFVSTSGVLYSQVLHEGDMFVVPRGLIHFEKNVGKGKAKLITAFNSQNPGAVVLPMNLFGSKPPIPDNILAQAYQVHPHVIRDIAANFRS